MHSAADAAPGNRTTGGGGRLGRRAAAAVLAGFGLLTLGCVAVSAKGNRFENRWDAVALDGRVYLIDTRTGNAHLVDVSHATPFKREGETADADAVTVD